MEERDYGGICHNKTGLKYFFLLRWYYFNFHTTPHYAPEKNPVDTKGESGQHVLNMLVKHRNGIGEMRS